jgi:hypothetical protein
MKKMNVKNAKKEKNNLIKKRKAFKNNILNN